MRIKSKGNNNSDLSSVLIVVFCLLFILGIILVSYWIGINGNDNTKGQVECRLSDNQIIRSGAYSKDSLRYADLIMRLNGRDDVDLSEYDMSINKPITGVKRKKNATTKNKTNS